MVKAIFADEGQSKSAEDRVFQSGVAAQVGLVIGKLHRDSDRGLVYDLIPTPPTDGGDAACTLKLDASGGKDDKKKGSKGGKQSAEATTPLVIDTVWVAEHARQVSRMLLGGMNVVGIYLWASEASFKATSSAVLSQAVRGVAQAAPSHDSELEERLLIHVSHSPRRWSCRICTLASGSLRPCDFKMGKLLASLQPFRCTYNFEIRLPISQAGSLGSTTFKNRICKGIAILAKDLQSAKALINGHLVTENLHLSLESPHDVEFLMPFNKRISTEACSSEEVAGLVVFSGAVHAFAYLGSREPILQAISHLKNDVISSLRSRLDIITDEAEVDVVLSAESGGEARGDVFSEKSIHQLTLAELRKPCTLLFPRRVLVPWLSGIFICDYLQASETSEDMKDHCKEMMSMDVPIETSAVIDLETPPISATSRSFWDVVHEHPAYLVDNDSKTNKNSSIKRDVQSRKSERGNLNFIAAVLVLVSAILIGLAVVIFGPVKTAY